MAKLVVVEKISKLSHVMMTPIRLSIVAMEMVQLPLGLSALFVLN